MKVPMWMRLLAVVALVFAAAACGGDDDDSESTGSDTGSPSAPAEDEAEDEGDDEGGDVQSLTITAEDYKFDAADEIEGGVVELTLANEGNFTHEAAFIKVADGYDVDNFEEDFGPVIEGGPISDDFETISGVGEAEAGDEITSTITLPEGNYLLLCTLNDSGEGGEGGEEGGEEGEGGEASADDQDAEGATEGVEEDEGETSGPPAHYTLGMLQEVTVTAEGGADIDAMPETDGVVEAVDYGFEIPELEAGAKTLTFHNTSEEQIHHGIFFEFPEGVDEAGAREALTALFSAPEGTPPPEGTPEPEEAGFTFVFGPGMAGTFDLELESGRTYAVTCFLQDRTGGPPHAIAHEMVEVFTVG